MIHRFGLLLRCLPALPAIVVVVACSSTTTNAGTASGEIPADGGGADSSPSDASTGGTSCTKARDDALLPIDRVSTGAVAVISDTGGVKTIYVDASAGGLDKAIKNPRTYVDLATGSRVDVTDKTAPESPAWDLALKRDKIFTNSGDAGIGDGGALQIGKTFDAVTDVAANAATLEKEKFFDADCNLQKDMTESVSTTFSDWYDYDQATHIPAPKDVTYVVRGGTGKKYKLAITSYNGLPDGGTGQGYAFYILKVSAL
jgi:hypothetical protein